MVRKLLVLLILVVMRISHAQEISIISKETVPTEKEIVDLLIEGNKKFLLTNEGSIIEIIDGQLIVGPKDQFKKFYDRKTKSDLPQDFDLDRYKFLTSGDGVYYGCIFDWSYSSRIVKVDPLGRKGGIFLLFERYPWWYVFRKWGLLCLSNHNKEMLLMLILTGILLRLPVG